MSEFRSFSALSTKKLKNFTFINQKEPHLGSFPPKRSSPHIDSFEVITYSSSKSSNSPNVHKKSNNTKFPFFFLLNYEVLSLFLLYPNTIKTTKSQPNG